MKMNILHISKVVAIIGLLLMGVSKADAQVTVDAKIDSLQLMIGEQAKVELEVSLNANQKLQMPLLSDTLVRGVEILDIAKPDTQMLKANACWSSRNIPSLLSIRLCTICLRSKCWWTICHIVQRRWL